MKKLLNFLLIIIIFILSFFALKDLYGPKFYTSHDGQSHLARLYEFDRILKEGQFPPRWAGQFSGTRGYPVFVFAYPLPYWFGEVFHLLGFNLAESLKLVFALFYLFSGIGMYLLVKEIFKNNWAAFVSAILWTWAPYRFVKIFVTASLGESVAFAFIPLIFLFLYKLVKKPNKSSFVGFTVSLASLVLSHLITLIIFFPLMICFVFWSLRVLKKKEKIRRAKTLLIGSFLAFCLSAFYLIPAVWEIRYTHYPKIISLNYGEQFVVLKKLLYSPWGYGAPGFGDDLSLQVGIAQWLAALMGGIIFISNIKNIINKKRDLALSLPFIFGLNFLLSIFLMLKVSKIVWGFLTPLQKVDTPWRFLSLSVFTAAFAGGWSVNLLKKKDLNLAILASTLILFLAFYGNRNHLRINASIDYPDKYFESYYWIGSGWSEYVPIWARKEPYSVPPEKKVEVLKGDCQIENNIFKKSNLISFKLSCSQQSEILVHNYYYPGWRLFVNGEDLTKTMLANLKQAQGLVIFQAQEGKNNIELKFGETKLRLLADLISLVALFVFFLVAIQLFPKRFEPGSKRKTGNKTLLS